MRDFCLKLINIYQRYLSFDGGILQILAPNGACKYRVHCSQYTKLMIMEYGVMRGVWLGLKRIVSCI